MSHKSPIYTDYLVWGAFQDDEFPVMKTRRKGKPAKGKGEK